MFLLIKRSFPICSSNFLTKYRLFYLQFSRSLYDFKIDDQRTTTVTTPISLDFDPSKLDENELLSKLNSVDDVQLKQYIRIFGKYAQYWRPNSKTLANMVAKQSDVLISDEHEVNGDDLANTLHLFACWDLDLPPSIDKKARDWLRSNLDVISPDIYFSFLLSWAMLDKMVLNSTFTKSLANKGLMFLSQANNDQLVNYLWAWRKGNDSLFDINPKAVQLWFDLSLNQIPSWNDKHISISFLSLVREEIKPQETWWNAILSKIVTLDSIGPQACANILHSFTKLLTKECKSTEKKAVRHVAEMAVANLDKMKVMELANSVRALGLLEVDPSEIDNDFWFQYWKIFELQLNEMLTIDLVMHMQFWDETNHFPHVDLLRKIEKQILDIAERNDITVLIGRMASMIRQDIVSDSFLRNVFDRWFVDIISDFDLCNGLYSWTTAGIDPGKMNYNFWEWFWKESIVRFDRLDGYLISYILIALSQLSIALPRNWLLTLQDALCHWNYVKLNGRHTPFSYTIVPRTLTVQSTIKIVRALSLIKDSTQDDNDMPINKEMISRFFQFWIENISDTVEPADLCYGFHGFCILSPNLFSNSDRLTDFWTISESFIPKFTAPELYSLLKCVSRLKLQPPNSWVFAAVDAIPKKPCHTVLYGRFLACLSTIRELMDPLHFEDVSKQLYRLWYKTVEDNQQNSNSIVLGVIGMMYVDIDPGQLTPGFWRKFWTSSQHFIYNLQSHQRIGLLQTITHFCIRAPDDWINNLMEPNSAQHQWSALYLVHLARYRKSNIRFRPSDYVLNTLFNHWHQSLHMLPIGYICMVIQVFKRLEIKPDENTLDNIWYWTAEKASKMSRKHVFILLNWVTKEQLSPPVYWLNAIRDTFERLNKRDADKITKTKPTKW